MTKFINLTPHIIRFADSEGNITHELQSEGIARVKYHDGKSNFPTAGGIPVRRAIIESTIDGLPAPEYGNIYVVSMPVAQVTGDSRVDVLAPDTGPSCIRKDGHPYAVRGLICYG